MAAGAVNIDERWLSGRRVGVNRFREQAFDRVVAQPLWLFLRMHESGDTEKRQTHQEDKHSNNK